MDFHEYSPVHHYIKRSLKHKRSQHFFDYKLFKLVTLQPFSLLNTFKYVSSCPRWYWLQNKQYIFLAPDACSFNLQRSSWKFFQFYLKSTWHTVKCIWLLCLAKFSVSAFIFCDWTRQTIRHLNWQTFLGKYCFR